jgi:CHAT domain-containing protein/tetratricopeptide (TPR) repeat protein
MTAGFGQSRSRGTLNALRAGLLACVAVVPLAALAQPADPRAEEIQSLLDDEQSFAAEKLAREALADAERALAAAALVTADFHRLLGDALYVQRRFEEAEPHFRRAFEMRERFLGEHADTAVSAADLGYTLRNLGRLEDAEPFYRKALDIRIAVLGADHAETAKSWQRLARLVDQRGDHLRGAELMDGALAAGRTAFAADDPVLVEWTGERAAMLHDGGKLKEAEAGYREVLRLAAQGIVDADGATAATAMVGLANLLSNTGRPDEAETMYRAALAARERMYGPVHASVASVLEGMGRLYERTQRYADALPAYERALAIRDSVGGDFNAASADNLFRMGGVLAGLDRAADAEKAYRRALTIRETLDGLEARSVADVLRALAGTMRSQDRLAEAESIYKRAIAIDEATLPPDHPYLAFDMMLLGVMYSGQQRFSEARPLLERAVAIMESSEATRSSVPVARTALASLLFAQGDLDGAAGLTERSLHEVRDARGPVREVADLSVVMAQIRLRQEQFDAAADFLADADAIYAKVSPGGRSHIRVSAIRGSIAADRGDYAVALPIFRDVLGRLEATYGADHPETGSARFELGRTLFAMGDFAGAAEALEKGAKLVERVAAVDAAAAFQTRTGNVEDQAIARGAVFDGLVKSYDRLRGQGEDDTALAEKAFLVAQRVIESQAAQALAQMAARQAAGSGPLAELARQRQDAAARWRRADVKLTAALAVPPADRNAEDVAELRAELDAADAAIVAVDARLASEFPDFAALQRPAPVGFDAVRQRLGESDVLLFFADTAGFGGAEWETYLWAVPKSGAPRWTKLPRSTGGLIAAVRELRMLMGVAGEVRGAASLAARPDVNADRPARALTAANELYGATLAPVADLIAGKSLVVVPSKRLAGLPFHLLVDEVPGPGSPDRYRDAGWLVKKHAITVLPAVSALGATSTFAARPSGGVPYLGFANPLLTGRNGRDHRAFDREACAHFEPPHVLIAAQALPELSSLFRGAVADVEAVRQLDPLPETAEEACAIAQALGSGADGVKLGGTATEVEAKRLSGTGEMAKARILHFATHGLVSGELEGLAEPAIVLTPPAEASVEDDGLLTASEVTTLKLDADWVILSACNTASGDGGGEALSGLARAFFYAGARSLMVSHWPVASDAAVRLATGAIGEIAADPEVSRAEALRRAMAAEIAAGGRRADPANWAPFIVVGG